MGDNWERHFENTVLLPKLFHRCNLFSVKMHIFGKSLEFAEFLRAISMYTMRLYIMYLLILC